MDREVRAVKETDNLKNKSIWKWALCGIGVLLLLGAASHYFWHWSWNGPSGFGSRFGHGPGGDMLPHKLRGGFDRGGSAGHGGGAGYGGHPLLRILLPIGLLVGGMLLWRSAKEKSFLRITGMVMTAAGVLILTPPVLGFIILIAAAYFYYRTRKQPQAWGGPSDGQAAPVIIPVEPIYTENLNNAQILDEWEQQTLKEDK